MGGFSQDVPAELNVKSRSEPMVVKARNILEDMRVEAKYRLTQSTKEYEIAARRREDASVDLDWISRALDALSEPDSIPMASEDDDYR